MARFRFNVNRANLPFWVLIAFLAFTFLTGGGSRDDVQSLVILRPVAVIMCVIAILSLRWEQVQTHRLVLVMASTIFLLVAAHLIPLPPAVWRLLPGRNVVAQVDVLAGLGPVWRPLTLVPLATWNALFSLFVPLAVLLFGIQLTREQRFRLLYVVLGWGLVSGFCGLMQAVGSANGPLYLYRITMPGAAVGLFANRNHQALLLASMFPLLVVYATAGVGTADEAKRRGLMAVAFGTVLIPLILVTGSRAGLLVAVAALGLAALLYRKPFITIPNKRKVVRTSPKLAIGAFAIFCLGSLTILMSRAEALRRLSAPDQTEDLRFRIWGPIADMAWSYFPFGSGIGSFAEVFKIGEPDAVLNPTYVNHAHNDWLELYMTAGLPGLLMLSFAVVLVVRKTIASYHSPGATGRDVPFARLGASIIFLIALASAGDYPLRTPSLMCLFVIALLWLAGEGTAAAKRAGGN